MLRCRFLRVEGRELGVARWGYQVLTRAELAHVERRLRRKLSLTCEHTTLVAGPLDLLVIHDEDLLLFSDRFLVGRSLLMHFLGFKICELLVRPRRPYLLTQRLLVMSLKLWHLIRFLALVEEHRVVVLLLQLLLLLLFLLLLLLLEDSFQSCLATSCCVGLVVLAE